MSRHHADQQQSASRTRRQQEDLRRMRFRRAIEDYSEQRRLNQEVSDFPELGAMGGLMTPQVARHFH
jgi:hypothetical protein